MPGMSIVDGNIRYAPGHDHDRYGAFLCAFINGINAAVVREEGSPVRCKRLYIDARKGTAHDLAVNDFKC